MRTALVAGGLLAFALSFDEIIVTNFTIGAGEETLPIWIFTNLFRAQAAADRQRRRGDRRPDLDHPRLPRPPPDRARRAARPAAVAAAAGSRAAACETEATAVP